MAKMRPRGFPVERGKIHEFANAILDEHPHYHDEEAARSAGLPAVVAPPTFLMAEALFEGAGDGPPAEIADIDMRFALHGSQELVYERPLVAGDVLTGEPGELKTYQKRSARGGSMKFIEFETIYRDREGEVVARSRMTVVQTDVAEGKS